MAAGLLNGKAALITGASRGIGRAIALELSASGAAVALVARDLTKLDALSRQLNSAGATALYNSFDLALEDSTSDLVDWLKEKKFNVDILVNNAGIYGTDSIGMEEDCGWDSGAKSSIALWNKTLAVNLSAAFGLARLLAPQMVERRWGRIINISSISGQKAEVFGTAYSASKFGLIGITQSLALELARHGVTVNSVCPGWVATDMAQEQINDPQWCRLNDINPEESLDIARLSVPQMRLIQPEEVASLVGYLCTESARGITGQAINICGGLSIT